MPTLSIELLKPHTHASKRFAAGDRLDLPDASGRWLIAQGVAKPATSPTTADSKPTRRDTASGTTHIPQGD